MATSELSCQVSEENHERREAFRAEWNDLTLSTRPEEGCSLHEEDVLLHETYHQQGQCQALVQRSPWLMMRMGILGRGLQEYQLPYQRVLPLPIFTPTKLGAAKEEREDTPLQLLALEAALGGQCVDRQDVAEITKQLPPVVPVSKPGALHRSLSRSMSQEAQRG
ncbi:telethonin [Trichechus manatus latirostris]|uniref:Telethonin n=1 Tax=Trichechus manatus latirostris TaxID=127582 RepID=A0A2Y9DNR7_TRIMA|nr:telethonin [Trichechus manatus latirostris]